MKKDPAGKKTRNAAAAPKLKLPEFSHSLPMLLLRGREAVMRYFRPSLLEHGITEQQWRVLRALSSVDEMEVMMLADATYLLAPSMSRILKDLHKRGLLTRRSDKRDLRRNLVAISPKGSELINTLSPRSEAAYTEIAARFGPANFNELGNLLLKLEAELQPRAPGNAGASMPQRQHRSSRLTRR
ncbi:MAG TPA: homoprotocatechuate degradation operon regulator HpaR [Bauldia sp.]|nr:homoprotocatechuate degradation operon regulator HpaR [Bauldia sp.]